ncbi:uncharacterized protein DS421_1g29940 [Arachis hypogaea]|nr:uncharacterized protein DS421_1g29940 [Arachis hypogaea]
MKFPTSKEKEESAIKVNSTVIKKAAKTTNIDASLARTSTELPASNCSTCNNNYHFNGTRVPTTK